MKYVFFSAFICFFVSFPALSVLNAKEHESFEALKAYKTNSTGTIIGDANCDGKVDTADIVEITNYMMKKPSDNFNFIAADVNMDGEVDDGDIEEIVKIIMGLEPSGDSNPSNDSGSSIDFVGVRRFANNSRGNQSSASYGDYLVLVPRSRGYLYLYNLKTKKLLYSLKMAANTEKDYKGSDLYHCNQTTFGVDFYEPNDPLPLLYISQRAREDRRCFLEVYRLLPICKDGDNDYSSMEAHLVQTIYFPAMTSMNSLGNVNCAIDTENRLMYTYSRNNNKSDENYRECKISCFDLPNPDQEVVYLENEFIKSSFMLGCSAYNMQGGCVKNGLLYIGQGYKSAGYIYLNVVDLKNEKLLERIDLLAKGVEWEPEGCFVYNENIMISTGNNIWELIFE